MNNDYECPKCHNKFPSQNKVMHDIRCTEENPMALDKSRQNLLNNSNQNSHNEKEEMKNSQEKLCNDVHQKQNPQSNPPIPPPQKKLSESGEFPEVFVCEICGETFALSEKKDHMYCHNLEKEEKDKINNFQPSERDIEQQRQIESQIKRENEMRRQMQNQQYQNVNQQQYQRMNLPNYQNQNNMPYLNAMRMPQYSNNIQFYNNNNNNQNNQQSNIQMRTIIRDQNGQTIIREYAPGGNTNMNNTNNMNYMMMNPFRMMYGNSVNNTNRINLPFSNFNDSNISAMLEQVMQMMRNRGEHPTDQAILNELPETQIDDVTKLDPEKKNCVICLGDFKNGDKATVLPCIHLFHSYCIQNWLKTKNCCPICKYRLTGENLNSQPQM